jgi:hypothetical protein
VGESGRSRPVRAGGPTATIAPGLANLSGLLDDVKCFALVRQHRWPEGVRGPDCNGEAVIGDGYDDTQPHRQRDPCAAAVGSDAPMRDARRGTSRSDQTSAEVMP